MNIGNQIKAFRLKKSVTQEAMAEHFGITAQAISKWECGTSVPDISLLPELSAYFGVTIDALFALDDETRMERIQNMIWDVRFIPQTDIDAARSFLLEKSRRVKNISTHRTTSTKNAAKYHCRAKNTSGHRKLTASWAIYSFKALWVSAGGFSAVCTR